MNRFIQLKLFRRLLVMASPAICLGLSPVLQATDVGSVVPPNGNANTADGIGVLDFLTTGIGNSGFGYFALGNDTSGSNNTATGRTALFNNTTGAGNTATGVDALRLNSTTSGNTANGYSALYHNTAGNNTAVGWRALYHNTTGSQNTACGLSALFFNSTGPGNTATGYQALLNNTSNYNTAVGYRALSGNTNGVRNIAIGASAGDALTTGHDNVCIGTNVHGVAGESNTTRILNVYSSVANGRAVYVNSDNKIGTLASSRRFKEQIKPMDKASEALFALKPVTFRYKQDIDPAQALSFGLIAEDVAKVDSDLITRDERGKPETVRYEAVNAMLLNEFLKEHRTVEEQGRRLEQQETTIAKQQEQIEALTAGLQKVSAQVEMSRLAPQMFVNNQ